MKRAHFDDDPAVDGGLYFESTSTRPRFSTGCTPLDLEVQGLSKDQLINVVGDSSTGKSLLMCEWAATFMATFPGSIVRIKDVEDAYDEGYLRSIGIPMDAIEMVENKDGEPGYVANTVEGVQKDIFKQLARSQKTGEHILYIIDSWDVLSEEQEQDKEIGKSKSRANKAKVGSEFGRRLWHEMASAHVTIIIVSQIRDNIGVMFGPKYRRSGGNWFDFLCSQVFWLFQDSTAIERTHKGVKRKYGRWTRVRCSKNRKTGDCEDVYMPIIKGYGVDDLMACTRYLIEVGKAEDQWDGNADEAKTQAKKYMNSCWKYDAEKYASELSEMAEVVKKVHGQIMKDFRVRRKKDRTVYGS